MPSLPGARSPTVLFRPAAGPRIGGGHVMRDLSLATALSARGARCVFAVDAFGEQVMERFGSAAFQNVSPSEAGAVDADVLVLDDFTLDEATQAALKGRSPLLVVIDDLADRPLAADILVDPSHGRSRLDYAGKLPFHARALLGPAHALLRPAFAALRKLSPAHTRGTVERVFVSFGLGDVGAVTIRAVEIATRLFPEAEIDVVVGRAAGSDALLHRLAARWASVRITTEATDIAERLSVADLAIGAGGSATWERACLGVPSVCVILADNQRDLARILDGEGIQTACELLDPAFDAAFSAALQALAPASVRSARSAAARTLCDGLGAERVATAILEAV